MPSYTLDPTQLSLERFREVTARRTMLPSRSVLQEDMDQRYQILEKAGIRNLGELIDALKNQKKMEAFSAQSGLQVGYLKLLRREARSYLARPFPLSDFPGIPFEFTEVLKSLGIRNTRDFFERAAKAEYREKLSRQSGIPADRLRLLHELCDLSRITGFGGSSCRMLHQAGIRSVREFTEKQVQGIFREEDLQYCLEYARIIVEIDQMSQSQ